MHYWRNANFDFSFLLSNVRHTFFDVFNILSNKELVSFKRITLRQNYLYLAKFVQNIGPFLYVSATQTRRDKNQSFVGESLLGVFSSFSSYATYFQPLECLHLF